VKSYRKERWFNVPQRMGFVNVTGDVDECLKESGVREGLCLGRTTGTPTGNARGWGGWWRRRRKRVLVKIIGE